MTGPSPSERFPASSAYDEEWVLSLDMGPHPLRLLEELLGQVALPRGARVLDVGCGRGATSVFLARQLDARVDALDLWVGAAEIEAVVAGAGVATHVRVRQADVRTCDLEPAAYDAVVCIDAYEYVGTDVHLLPRLVAALRPGGWLGIATPSLRPDPYEADPPAAVRAAVGAEAAAWHSPEWWRRHWELSGLLTELTARWAAEGRRDWLRWVDAAGEPADSPVRAMLEACTDDQLGFALVSGRRL